MDVEALLAELDTPSVDARLKVLEQLRKASKLDDAHRAELAELGGIEKLHTMLATAMDDRLKERVVIVFVYLAKTDAIRDQLREVGVLDLLLRELTTSNKVVLHNAMAALVNATINNTVNQNHVREVGALATVVALLGNSHAKTRQNACWLLKKLTTNNAKNCDALRELGVLSAIVPLLAADQTADVQEHAVGLLAFMLDKHTRNRATFKDVARGPAALLDLQQRVAGTRSKTEEYANACVLSMGGAKRMQSEGSSRSGFSGHSQHTGDERLFIVPPEGGGSAATASGAVTERKPKEPQSSREPPSGSQSARAATDKGAANHVKDEGDKRTPRSLFTLLSRGGGDKSPRDKKDQQSPRGKKDQSSPRAKKDAKSADRSSAWTQSIKGTHDDDDPILRGGGGGRHSLDEED